MDNTIAMTGKLEPRGGWEATHCSVAKALEVVGTRSSLLILREAFYGTRRFEDFSKRAGLSEPVSAERLRDLVEAGLLSKEPYKEPGQRTRSEYRLTEKGQEFLPVLVALMQWGDRWENDGGRVGIQHAGCGATVHAELRCEAGHAADGELELSVRS